MRNYPLFLSLILLLTFFNACKNQKEQEISITKKSIQTHTNNSIGLDYIELLSIQKDSVSYQIIDNKNSNNNVTLYKAKLPFQNIVVFSSSTLAYLDAIDALDQVQGVYDVNWVYNKAVQNKIDKNQIQDLGAIATANIEQILSNPPDAIISYTTTANTKLLRQAQDFGIPVIYLNEFNEPNALAKAEYVKILGLLTGKKDQAEHLFDTIQKEYNTLKKLTSSQIDKPTVLLESMRGDIWYMPSGSSYPAQLIRDAGGEYLWDDVSSKSTKELNFEQVLAKAKDAEFWLNSADVSSITELYDIFNGHNMFQAAKRGNVYAYNKQKNSKGANDYFEKGTVRPDLILKDLIYILHPNLLPKHKLYFYKRLSTNE